MRSCSGASEVGLFPPPPPKFKSAKQGEKRKSKAVLLSLCVCVKVDSEYALGYAFRDVTSRCESVLHFGGKVSHKVREKGKILHFFFATAPRLRVCVCVSGGESAYERASVARSVHAHTNAFSVEEKKKVHKYATATKVKCTGVGMCLCRRVLHTRPA